MAARPARDGLGFPFVQLAIMAGSAIVGKIRNRNKTPKVTTEDAKKAVQQIYLELFERDPLNPYDAGMEGYVKCLVDGWCDVDFVRTEVLKSPEYRDVQARKAAVVYGPAASGGSGVTTAGPGALPSFASMSVGGVPITYLVGGVVLLSLLKKKKRRR